MHTTLYSFDAKYPIVNTRMPSPWAVGLDKCDACLIVESIEMPQLGIPSMGVSQNCGQIDWFAYKNYQFCMILGSPIKNFVQGP